MSTKIENVVYRATKRDEISANFASVSFSTATGDFTNYPGEEMPYLAVQPGRKIPLTHGRPVRFGSLGIPNKIAGPRQFAHIKQHIKVPIARDHV